MMEGIEVLAVGSIGAGPILYNWGIAITVGLLVFILFGFLIYLNTDNLASAILLSIIIGIVLGLVAGEITSDYAYTVPTYKVILEDNVSMNSFMEKYEIISQEGKIYTIKERLDEITDNHTTP